jgi:hypothetical protein
MQLSEYKGKRIRASDKSLVFNFATVSLIAIFSMVFLLLNVKQILCINLENVSILKNGTLQLHITSYFVFSVIFATAQ